MDQAKQAIRATLRPGAARAGMGLLCFLISLALGLRCGQVGVLFWAVILKAANGGPLHGPIGWAIVLAFLVGTGPIRGTSALTVYDCEAERTTYEVVDLLATEDCPRRESQYQPPETRQMQILHIESRQIVQGHQCTVIVTKNVASCESVTHHLYGVMTTVWRQATILPAKDCREAVKTGRVRVQGRTIDVDLDTIRTSAFFTQGGTDGSGWVVCRTFKSGSHMIKSGYEQTMVELYVGTVSGAYDQMAGTVKFKGVTELLAKGTLADSVVGRIVWDVPGDVDCSAKTSRIYLGAGNVHRPKETTTGLTGSIALIESEGTGQFAGFHLRRRSTYCGMDCYHTQVAGLLTCPIANGTVPKTFPFRADLGKDLSDPQLLSRIGYLHLDTNQRMTDRFQTVMDNLCQVEMAAWRSRLHNLAGTDSPYALLDTYGRGFTMQVAGAAAYILKCAEREATRADYRNCTQEVPVKVGDDIKFADPLTWIVKDFPTIVPCSPVMPVRWNIMGKWYCATPGVRPCNAPRQMASGLNRTEEGDFSRGLGKGIFTESQMAEHKAFWRAATSRRAVVSKATLDASLNSHGGDLGVPLSTSDLNAIATSFQEWAFPLLPELGRLVNIFGGAFLILSVLGSLASCTIRMMQVYADQGCGPWVLLGVWNTLYTVFHVPQTLLRQGIENVKRYYDPTAAPDILRGSNGGRPGGGGGMPEQRSLIEMEEGLPLAEGAGDQPPTSASAPPELAPPAAAAGPQPPVRIYPSDRLEEIRMGRLPAIQEEDPRRGGQGPP